MRKEETMENQKAIAIYTRKSKFTGKGESIGNQVEVCKDYVSRVMGPEDAQNCIVYEDEGFSGGNLRRPAFKRMMEDAHEHKLKAIVVYRLDRISRSVSDFSALVDELGRLGVGFISVREQFDIDAVMGRAMMYVSSVFSQLERETIAERIRDNMHELAKTGRWLGGNTPTGYQSKEVSTVTADGKTRKSYWLTPIEEEAEVVRTIFELFLKTDSLTAVETELLRRRVKTKQGNDFTRFAIKGILQNPVYAVADKDVREYFRQKGSEVYFEPEDCDGVCGIMAYNRTEQGRNKSSSLLPEDQWIIALGFHPGLVSGKQWLQAQQALERNKEKGYRKPRHNEALLTGLVYCTCGSRMYPKLTKRKTADGELIYSYICKMKERSKGERCSQGNINGNALDAMVLEQIKTLAEDHSYFAMQMEKYRRFYTDNQDSRNVQLEKLRQIFAQNEKTIVSLVDSLAMVESPAARPHIIKRIEDVTAENKALEQQIREQEGVCQANELTMMEFLILQQKLVNFSSAVDTMTVEEKRSAIRSVVRRIVWDGKCAHIFFFGAEEGDVEFPDIETTADEGERTENCSVDDLKVPWGEDSK